MKYYLGFDIGGTKTALSLGQLNGKNLSIVPKNRNHSYLVMMVGKLLFVPVR